MLLPEQPEGYWAISGWEYKGKSVWGLSKKKLREEFLGFHDDINKGVIKWLLSLPKKDWPKTKLLLELREGGRKAF